MFIELTDVATTRKFLVAIDKIIAIESIEKDAQACSQVTLTDFDITVSEAYEEIRERLCVSGTPFVIGMNA